MSSKFAVGFLSYFDNELVVEIHSGDGWKDALCKHSKLTGEGMEEFKESVPDSLEDAKTYFFDTDMAIDVKELTS